MTHIRVTLLGQPALVVGGTPAALGARAREVLAVLAARAGTTVPDAEIIDIVWGGDAPRTVANQLQIAVHRLRSALGGDARLLRRENGGYALDAPTDLAEFRAHLADGDRHARAGDWAAAHGAYERATGLWREPFTPGRDAHRAALDEERLEAVTRRLVAALSTGTPVAKDAEELLAAHPLRERFWLLRALAGPEDPREILDRAVAELGERTGLDPGRELRELARMLDAGEPALPLAQAWIVGAARRRVPMELPAGVGDFVGRGTELARIAAALDGGDAVVTVAGLGGVGKTALAVRAARAAAAHYPDGCLFTDLRGADDVPRDPHEVIGGLLRSLGIPEMAVPKEPEARAGRYRELMARRRALVVLDNAAHAAHATAVLPGSGAVLVTSRSALTGLGGPEIRLGTLPPEDAVELLTRLAARPATAAAHRLADLAGRLPLALRIVGARLARRRDLDFERLAARLDDEDGRLDQLADGDRMVRRCVDIGYRRLSGQAAALLLAVAWLPVGEVTLATLAGLAGTDLDAAAPLAAELADAQLLTPSNTLTGALASYLVHDLVRLYVRETGARPASVVTGYRALLAGFTAADRALPVSQYAPPVSPEPEAGVLAAIDADPMAWCDAHRALLVAGVAETRALGEPELAWRLSASATGYLEYTGRLDDLRAFHPHIADIDLPAARADVRWQTARLHRRHGRPAESLAAARAARRAFLADGDLHRAVAVIFDLADAHRALGHQRAALAAARWGLARFGELDATPAMRGAPAWLKVMLGLHAYAEDDLVTAKAHVADAIGDFEACGGLAGLAYTTSLSGRLEHEEGHYSTALAAYREALRYFQKTDGVPGELLTLQYLVDCLIAAGDLDEAADAVEDGFRTATEYGLDSTAVNLARSRAVLLQKRGDLPAALAAADEALSLARAYGAPNTELEVHRVTVRIAAELGDTDRVERACHAALALIPADHPFAEFFSERLTPAGTAAVIEDPAP